MIDCVVSIDAFEKQGVVLKVMSQSPRLRDNVKNIGIDQSLSNSALFEHICLQNINKLYKHDWKCDNQQQLKDILEAAMFYTNEGFTDNSPRYPMTPTTAKKPTARKSLSIHLHIRCEKENCYPLSQIC